VLPLRGPSPPNEAPARAPVAPPGHVRVKRREAPIVHGSLRGSRCRLICHAGRRTEAVLCETVGRRDRPLCRIVAESRDRFGHLPARLISHRNRAFRRRMKPTSAWGCRMTRAALTTLALLL
jgi:hypothetical protein